MPSVWPPRFIKASALAICAVAKLRHDSRVVASKAVAILSKYTMDSKYHKELQAANVVDILVGSATRFWSTDDEAADILPPAMIALFRLDAWPALFSKGGAPAVVALLRRYAPGQETCIAVRSATAHIADMPGGVEAMVAAGVVEPLLAALKAEMHSPYNCTAFLRVLEAFCVDEDVAPACIAAGASELLVEAMRTHCDKISVITNAKNSLAALMRWSDGLGRLISCGAPAAAATALSAHAAHDKDVALDLANALLYLVITERDAADEHTPLPFDVAGMINAVAGALRDVLCHRDTHVLTVCSRLLLLLLRHNANWGMCPCCSAETAERSAAAEGLSPPSSHIKLAAAVAAVVGAFKSQPHIRAVLLVRACAECLWRLCELPEGQPTLRELGAAQALLSALRLHSAEEMVVKHCLRGLNLMGHQPATVAVLEAAGAGETVIKALRRYMHDSDVAFCACDIISTLLLRASDEAVAAAYVRQGVALTLVAALQEHAEHEAIAREACAALATSLVCLTACVYLLSP